MLYKKIVFTTIAAAIGGVTLYFTANSTEPLTESAITEDTISPEESAIVGPTNMENVDHESTYAERISRKSSVKVYHTDFRGFGSGSYIKIKNRYFVLTAAHVVRDRPVMMIMGRDEILPAKVIYSNDASDIAFLEVERMHSRIPVKLRLNHSPHISDNVAYTGFPNGTDLLTITGRVSGFRGQWLVVQGYTWMGASGSGVFDSQGRLVGVVSMVEVGQFHGPQIIEDVVYVAKLSKEDIENFRGLISKN